MLKKLLFVLILLAVIGGGYWGYRYFTGDGSMFGGGGFAMPVETAIVEPGVVKVSLEAVGTLRANEGTILRPEVAGRVAKVAFEEGTSVTAGAPLIILDDSVERAELAQAKAKLTYSQLNYKRMKGLSKSGATAIRTLDEAVADLQVSEANVALAAARLSKTVISAPFDGMAGLRKVSLGQFVDVGQDLVSLQDIDPIKVDFTLPETELQQLAVGQKIDITIDALPDTLFSGQVYAIDSLVDEGGRSIAVRATIPNPQGTLHPGLFARIALILSERPGALVVPEEAIVPVGDEAFVYLVHDGKAKMVPVKLGQRQRGTVEVLTGLEKGQRVVTGGQIKLNDGMPVAPVAPVDAGDGNGGKPAEKK